MITHYLHGTDQGFKPINNLLIKRGQIIEISAINSWIKFAKYAPWPWDGFPRNPNGEDKDGKTEPATPKHPAKYCKRNSLVVRIGTGEPIQCGISTESFVVRTETDGLLYVTNNDDDCTDNEGYWIVNITVSDPPVIPPQNSKIDIHCHLFSAKSLIVELLISVWNGKVHNTRNYLTDLTNIVSWFAKIIKWIDGKSDYNSLFSYQRDEYRKSLIGANSKFAISPLMMDIVYFCNTNNPQTEEPDSTEKSDPLVPPNLMQEFLNLANKFKYDLIIETKRHLSQDEFSEETESFIDSVFEWATGICVDCTNNGALSPGYEEHMKELEDLYYKNAKHSTIYPFLAVDPRRPKIFDLIKRQVNVKYGPFKGVKLYPPMGFVPSHPKMDEIFAYCEAKGIPITVHTAPTGFVKESGKLWIKRRDEYGNISDKSYDLVSNPNPELAITSGTIASNPSEWEPVLKKHNNLKVNFAHFGGDYYITEYIKNPNYEKNWTRQILNLMRYKNVYCDISFVNDNAYEDKIGYIIKQNPILNERLLFGTDYIMIMKERELGDLRNYFNKYKHLPNNAFASNSIRFLTSEPQSSTHFSN